MAHVEFWQLSYGSYTYTMLLFELRCDRALGGFYTVTYMVSFGSFLVTVTVLKDL